MPQKKAFKTFHNSSYAFSSLSSAITVHTISNQVSLAYNQLIPGHAMNSMPLFLFSLLPWMLPLSSYCLTSYLTDKTLLSQQGLTPVFWKQQATVWMPTLTFTSYLILDTLWIYSILDFSIYITRTIISESYFKEFNDITPCRRHSSLPSI